MDRFREICQRSCKSARRPPAGRPRAPATSLRRPCAAARRRRRRGRGRRRRRPRSRSAARPPPPARRAGRSSRSPICTPSTVCWFGASTQSASSSSRKASSTRRMLSRSAAPTIVSAVSGPPPASPLRVAGPGGVEDGEAEGVAVAAVGLDQLVEPAAHVAGPVEAGAVSPRLGRLGRRLRRGRRCRRRLRRRRSSGVDRGRGRPSRTPRPGAAAAPANAPTSPASLLAQLAEQRRPAGPRPRGRSRPAGGAALRPVAEIPTSAATPRPWRKRRTQEPRKAAICGPTIVQDDLPVCARSVEAAAARRAPCRASPRRRARGRRRPAGRSPAGSR